jgi:hypothetical protein
MVSREQFDIAMEDNSSSPPSHAGFPTELVAAIALFKEDPSDENRQFAEEMFELQENPTDYLAELL